MKITYAHRRSAFYPFDDHGGPGNELPPSDIRAPWLAAVRARGFEGLEVGEASVGVVGTASRWLVPELVGTLRRRAPGVRLTSRDARAEPAAK